MKYTLSEQIILKDLIVNKAISLVEDGTNIEDIIETEVKSHSLLEPREKNYIIKAAIKGFYEKTGLQGLVETNEPTLDCQT